MCYNLYTKKTAKSKIVYIKYNLIFPTTHSCDYDVLRKFEILNEFCVYFFEFIIIILQKKLFNFQILKLLLNILV